MLFVRGALGVVGDVVNGSAKSVEKKRIATSLCWKPEESEGEMGGRKALHGWKLGRFHGAGLECRLSPLSTMRSAKGWR